MNVTEATLTEITRRLVATYQPEQVVLFGSHAWGEPDENSDVDLLVVLAESDEPAYRRASAGYRSLFGVGDLMDLLTRCAAADARLLDADPTVNDVAHALQTAQQFHAFVSAIVGERLPTK